MAKWPSLHELAASNIDDVNAMWSGLGYYRRARMLLEVRPFSSLACERGLPLTFRRARSMLSPITVARCPAQVRSALVLASAAK
jgi:hypothetical protein